MPLSRQVGALRKRKSENLHLNNIYFSLTHTCVVYCNQWAGKWPLRDILLKCALYGLRAHPFVCECERARAVGKRTTRGQINGKQGERAAERKGPRRAFLFY